MDAAVEGGAVGVVREEGVELLEFLVGGFVCICVYVYVWARIGEE